MKHIEAMKHHKSDDEVSLGLSDLNEGLQDLTEEGENSSDASDTSFGTYLNLLPIASAKVFIAHIYIHTLS